MSPDRLNSYQAVGPRNVAGHFSAPVWIDFAGLSIRSEINLTCLPQSGAAPCQSVPDIDLQLSRDPSHDGRLIHQWAGRYGLSLHAVGKDWIFRSGANAVVVTRLGHEMRCHCPDLTDLRLLGEIIERRVLPRSSYLHGRLPLHGAALGDDESAVMLLGASGAGKSTTTAALADRLDWKIFSDDMTILSDVNGGLIAHGAACGVSLWWETVEALNISPDRLEPMAGYVGKYSYRPERRPAIASPLSAIVVLSQGAADSAIRRATLAGPERLAVLRQQLVPFNPTDKTEIRDLMLRLQRGLRDIPVHILSYPRNFGKISELAEVIRRTKAQVLGDL